MKYSRKAWFANKFDVVICALLGPLAFTALLFSGLGEIMPQSVISGVWIGVLALIGMNVLMALVVTHKAWGWLMLPFYVIVRVLATILASLCFFFLLAGMAYQAQSKEKISKAWTKDDRSANYRAGVSDGKTGKAFKSAGGGIWGFLVSHTLEFCEK